MASIKVKYRPSSLADREGRVYYQVIHNRKTRHILTGYHLFPSEWDEDRSDIRIPYESGRAPHLTSLRGSIKRDIERFARIIRQLEDTTAAYTIESIIEAFNNSISDKTLLNEMEKAVGRLTRNGKTRTSQTYATTLRSFRSYRQDKDILLDCMSSEVMEGYQAWLQQNGVAKNTISFYLRILRAVYNRAVEEGLTENRYPFRHVYTGVDKTVKRSLPLTMIKKIKNLDLSMKPELDYARDMFILSFMLRGMSFIDMSYLKKTDLCNGHITYRRRKTHQQLTIAWTAEMQRILEKYPENRSDYLLPIIRKPGTNERYVFKNVGERINRRLKIIADMVGIEIPLSMYVARHSWASIAKTKGVPLSVISEGLGHEKESTTRIYLSTLDSSVIDKANDMILKLL